MSLSRYLLGVVLLINVSCSKEPDLTPNRIESEKALLQLNSYWDAYESHLSDNPDSSIYYMTQIKDLAESIENKEWLAAAYGELGEVYYAKGLLGQSITNHLHAAERFKELDQLLKLANAYTSIGVIFFISKDFDAAILYYEQAADIFHYEGKSYDREKIFRNIAISYKEKGEFQKAEEYLERSRVVALNANDDSFLCKIYLSAGAIQHEQGENEKAREYYLLAADLASTVSDSLRFKASAFNNIGETFLKEGNHALAEEWLLRALDLKMKINDPLFTQTTRNNYGKLLIKMGMYEKAIEYVGAWLNKADPEMVDNSVQEGLALIIESFLLLDKQADLSKNNSITSYSSKLSSYNKRVSQFSSGLEIVSQKQSVKLAVDSFFIQEQLNREKEKNKASAYAYIIPVISLLGAAISIYIFAQKNRKMKKTISNIEQVLNGSLRR